MKNTLKPFRLGLNENKMCVVFSNLKTPSKNEEGRR